MRIVRYALIFLGATAACGAWDQLAEERMSTVIRDLENMEQKFVSVAEAFPHSMYSWKPIEGVQTVGDVLMHVAAGNYAFSLKAGAVMSDSDAVKLSVDSDSFSEKAGRVYAGRQRLSHTSE